MSSIKLIIGCMFGPKLIKIYGNQHQTEQIYHPNTLEKLGDQVIRSLYVIWKIGVYTSPILAGILYQRGYFSGESLGPFSKLITSIGVILVISYYCKGLGRSKNQMYLEFFKKLEKARTGVTHEIKQQLAMYDFDFRSWPVEFNMHDISEPSQTKVYIKKPKFSNNPIQYLINLPFRIIAYLAIHTFGIRLIYPGTLGILQAILETSLIQGRSRLVEHNRGQRFKLQTIDNNYIDTMFVDQRNLSQNGNILVICSEGNAGFYEIGIMVTPIEAGYSTFGWNHPGFACSTGRPYPSQENNAIDAVVQFAIYKLGFKPENILLFGWSIGGYSTSWAAMNYPDIRGVIIDATFDDILPLAINHMPSWWAPIVKLAIREHVNLNIAEQLLQYPGPILLFRRTEDEVICIREGDLSSNRGNVLLTKILRHRYPKICNESQLQILKEYLDVTSTAQERILQKYNIDENECYLRLQSYITEYSKSYPMDIGDNYTEDEKNQLLLYLASKYLKDFKSTHCVNLPVELFQPPWDVEPEFVLP